MPTNMSVYSWFSHDLEIMPIWCNRSTIGDHLYWLNLIFLPSRPSVKHIIGSLIELQDTLRIKKSKQFFIRNYAIGSVPSNMQSYIVLDVLNNYRMMPLFIQ